MHSSLLEPQEHEEGVAPPGVVSTCSAELLHELQSLSNALRAARDGLL